MRSLRSHYKDILIITTVECDQTIYVFAGQTKCDHRGIHQSAFSFNRCFDVTPPQSTFIGRILVSNSQRKSDPISDTGQKKTSRNIHDIMLLNEESGEGNENRDTSQNRSLAPIAKLEENNGDQESVSDVETGENVIARVEIVDKLENRRARIDHIEYRTDHMNRKKRINNKSRQKLERVSQRDVPKSVDRPDEKNGKKTYRIVEKIRPNKVRREREESV